MTLIETVLMNFIQIATCIEGNNHTELRIQSTKSTHLFAKLQKLIPSIIEMVAAQPNLFRTQFELQTNHQIANCNQIWLSAPFQSGTSHQNLCISKDPTWLGAEACAATPPDDTSGKQSSIFFRDPFPRVSFFVCERLCLMTRWGGGSRAKCIFEVVSILRKFSHICGPLCDEKFVERIFAGMTEHYFW